MNAEERGKAAGNIAARSCNRGGGPWRRTLGEVLEIATAAADEARREEQAKAAGLREALEYAVAMFERSTFRNARDLLDSVHSRAKAALASDAGKLAAEVLAAAWECYDNHYLPDDAPVQFRRLYAAVNAWRKVRGA